MRKDPSVRDILKSGFKSETQVRNAINRLFDFAFDEFFKIVGALLVISALEFSANGIRISTLGILSGIGKFVLTLKIFSLLSSAFEESIFDVLDRRFGNRSLVSGILSTLLGLFAFWATWIFAGSAVRFLTTTFEEIAGGAV